MRKRDAARLDTLVRVLNILNQNQALFEDFEPVQKLYADLKSKVTTLNQHLVDLSEDSEGITADKQQSVELMTRQAVTLAKLAYVWAKSQNDVQLMQVFDLEMSDFKRISTLEAIVLATKLEEYIRPHLAELSKYRITAAKLDELKQSIAYASVISPKPKQQRSMQRVSKTHFSEDLKAAIIMASDLENLIIGGYSESDPRFVDHVLAAMRIFDPATRSTTLQIFVTDEAGTPLHEVECDILEISGEEQLTNTHGQAEIKSFRSGSYTLAVKKEGYQPIQSVFSIQRGERQLLNLHLKKSN